MTLKDKLERNGIIYEIVSISKTSIKITPVKGNGVKTIVSKEHLKYYNLKKYRSIWKKMVGLLTWKKTV